MAVTLNDHIHLSTTLSNVTNGVLLHTYKTLAENGREEVPVMFITVMRSLNSKLRTFVAKNGGGKVRLTDFRYTLILQEEQGESLMQRWQRIKNMQGEIVYLHDHYHDAGAHNAGYKTCFLETVGALSSETGPKMPKGYVAIELRDASL